MTVWAVFSVDLSDSDSTECLVYLFESEVSANTWIDDNEAGYKKHDFYYRELQVFA